MLEVQIASQCQYQGNSADGPLPLLAVGCEVVWLSSASDFRYLLAGS